MLIRRATPADLDTIKQCFSASLNATYGRLWSSKPLVAGDEDWSQAWLACSDGDIVGVGLSDGDAVGDLWVRPDSQGRGAGSALLAALEDEIAGRAFETARLRCLAPNLKARAFYRSRGWTEVRVYPHETIPLNTVDMTKVLRPPATIAAALLVRWGKLLLGRRAAHRRSFANCWDAIGGHLEPGETYDGALRRELREELGVCAEAFSVIGDFSVLDGKWLRLFLVTAWSGGEPYIANDEHTELRWFTVEHASQLTDLALPDYAKVFRALRA